MNSLQEESWTEGEGQLRVVVSGYACNPYYGSEKGVGWGWLRMIARRHLVTALVGDQHRKDIEQYCEEHPEILERVRFVYVRRTRWLWLEKVWHPAYLWSYHLWQWRAWREARKLHAERPFDLAHQLTYVGFRLPGYLWKLNTPFVWGPIGGLENTPWRFLPMMGWYGGAHFFARNVINTFHKALLPGPKRAFQRARGGIIAATPGMAQEIRRWYGEDAEVVCEIGPPPVVAKRPRPRDPDEPLRLIWSGLHNPGKALPLLLRALTLLPARMNWQLTILGRGRQHRKWRTLARKLGIDDRCRWTGWVSRENALKHMQRSHVFVITSMHDLTSTVLLEAMAQGLPVICPDAFGFRHVVTEACGIKVPVRSPSQFHREVARAIETLSFDEVRRQRMGARARERLNEFTWEKKATIVDRIYRGQMGSNCQDPEIEVRDHREIATADTGN